MKRLYRSETERMVAGICGGLAEYFDIDPVLVRLAFVLLAFASGIGIIAYLVLWLIMPPHSKVGISPAEIIKENMTDVRERTQELAAEFRSALAGKPSEGDARRPRRVWGLAFILLGVILLLSNLGLFGWFSLGRLWPLILIFLGLIFLWRRE
ncbi:MAG: PspC domain-containing protein [Chloroflexi bacterium]|nr:PspC domain-containing protein [Chloroflexota bacterium]